MVKLVWKVPGQAPLAFPLRQERISIGRDAGNDIRLPEPAVSSCHATIIRKAGRVVIHDLKSSNGTWVNGNRIDNQELVHGDMIAFGRVVMSFVDESQEAPAPPPSPAPNPQAAPKRVVSAPPPASPQPQAPTPPVRQPPPATATDRTVQPLSATIPRPVAPVAVAPPPLQTPIPTPASASASASALETTLPPLLAMGPSYPSNTGTSAPPSADQANFLPLTLPRLPDPVGSDTLPNPTTPDGGPDLKELDRLLGSIRSFRDQETDVVRQRQAELMREWRETLSYAEAMRARLASETRIRFFDVSERRQEIVLRIVRAPGEPTRLLSLTWGHPDQRDKAPDGIWMRATHQPDRRYFKSAEAVRELVATLASFLA